MLLAAIQTNAHRSRIFRMKRLPSRFRECAAGKILIGHSLGFVHGIKQRQDWKGWIAINSFPRFIKTKSKLGCVPARRFARYAHARLTGRSDKNPCRDFINLLARRAADGTLNVERLRDGLDELRDADIRSTSRMLPNVPGLVLAGGKDPLVPEGDQRKTLGRMANAILCCMKAAICLPQSDPDVVRAKRLRISSQGKF